MVLCTRWYVQLGLDWELGKGVWYLYQMVCVAILTGNNGKVVLVPGRMSICLDWE